jgi:hypothetical protein
MLNNRVAISTNNLYLERSDTQQPERYNIQSVIKAAIQCNNTLRLCNKKILDWYNNLPASTKQLLISACNAHSIKVVY